jgi:hypothetical protein
MARKEERNATVERVLTGRPVDDPAFQRVATALTVMAEMGRTAPSPERIARVAEAAARAVVEAPVDSPSVRVSAEPRRLRSLTPRLAVPLALVLVFTLFGGAAFASQEALPGDPLYGLNRALERLGIGESGVAKRLGEAARLAERGRADEALLHAAHSIADSTDAGADETAEVLADLAESFNEPTWSGDVPEQVAEMLRWMAENSGLLKDPDAAPGAFGQGVAEMARQISGERGRPDGVGPPASTPGNSSQGRPQGKPPNRP